MSNKENNWEWTDQPITHSTAETNSSSLAIIGGHWNDPIPPNCKPIDPIRSEYGRIGLFGNENIYGNSWGYIRPYLSANIVSSSEDGVMKRIINKIKELFNLRNLFNLWRPFDKIKPKTKGWYACTVEVHGQQRYVMNLYWYPITGRWKDNIRQTVFDDYKVYGYNDETHKEDKLLKTIGLCDRTIDVVAWKNIPNTYMKGFVKDEYL